MRCAEAALLPGAQVQDVGEVAMPERVHQQLLAVLVNLASARELDMFNWAAMAPTLLQKASRRTLQGQNCLSGTMR